MDWDKRSKAQKLRDAFLLHALFLEGVRNWQVSLFVPTSLAITNGIRAILAKRKIDFKNATKKDVQILATAIRSVLVYELTNYKTVLLKEVRTFLAKDVDVFQFILASISGIDYATAAKNSSNSIYGTVAANGTDRGDKRLWGLVVNSPIPASGLTIPASIDAFNQFVTAQFMRTINMSYANNEDTETLETDFFGDSTSDGVLDRAANAAKSVGSTIFASASAAANQAVSSVYYGSYQWCSVMDSRTTEICQSRNNEIYPYGQGPLPPAHINCRSTVIPYEVDNGEVDDTRSFTDWVAGLPQEVQDDVFTSREQDASQINPTHAKPLSVDDFDSKQTAMLQ